MYSLVIVEDEFTTRRGLVNMIRWDELGFRVDGEFSDGQELLEYLKSNVPDVILTDIKMTRVSGIEIARLVFRQNLPVQIVFLSGHKEFSLAQEAVEYHVFHYLLKPVDLAKLREVFRSLKERLDSQSIRENMVQSRLDHYSRLVNYEKQQFVTDAYFGALRNKEQTERRLGLIDSASAVKGKSRLFLVKIILRNYLQYREFLDNYGQQELQEQIVHILEYFDENLEYYPILWNDAKEEGVSIVGVFWENQNCGENEYDPKALESSIYDLMAVQAEVVTFEKLDAPAELMHYTENMGKNEPGQSLIRDMEYLKHLQNQVKLLHSYLCQNSVEQGMELADALLDNYFKGGSAFAQRQCIYAVTQLLDEIADHDLIVWNELYGECMHPLPKQQPEELRRWFQHRIQLLFDYQNKRMDSGKDTSIEKVMDYLKNHFNEDITLNAIAEAVFLNPTYISRLIKEQTGRNYTELVMEIRIERAIELLENSEMFVYEIAEMVGYNNLKYFYKVFRKVKGKSPGDYRPSFRQ